MLSSNLCGSIIQCHIDTGDPESFVVGRLIYVDSKWFLMQDISPEGRWNGLALYMQDDIVTIETHSNYLQRIKALVGYRKENMAEIPYQTGDPLMSLLFYARDSVKLVGLELIKSGYRDVNGFIDWLDNQTLCINQLDEFGQPDGKSFLSVGAITRCFVDDEESKCLEVLSKLSKGQGDESTVPPQES